MFHGVVSCRKTLSSVLEMLHGSVLSSCEGWMLNRLETQGLQGIEMETHLVLSKLSSAKAGPAAHATPSNIRGVRCGEQHQACTSFTLHLHLFSRVLSRERRDACLVNLLLESVFQSDALPLHLG